MAFVLQGQIATSCRRELLDNNNNKYRLEPRNFVAQQPPDAIAMAMAMAGGTNVYLIPETD